MNEPSKKIIFLKHHFYSIISVDVSFKNTLSQITNQYFKVNKQIGSKDRKVLSELIYTYFRYKFTIDNFPNNYIDKKFEIVFHFSKKVLSKSDTFQYIMQEWLNYSNNLDIDFNSTNGIFKNITQSFDLIPKLYRNEFLKLDIDTIHTIFSKSPITIRPAYSNLKNENYLHTLKANNFDFELIEETNSLNIVTFNSFEQLFKDNNLPYEVQDNGSILLSKYIASLDKNSILDACAGSGGKSLSIKYFNSKPEIDLYDTNTNRLKEFNNRNNKFSGLKLLIQLDKSKKYDIVLIDAPCTGSGTIRRNPDKQYTIDEDIITEYNTLQNQILETYSIYVKKGGILIYITCSLFEKENISVINKFLNSNNDFIGDEITSNIITNNSLKITNFAYQLIPTKYNGDIFFISQLRKC